MIAALIDSPWADSPPPTTGRHPKAQDDFALASCQDAGGLAPEGKARVEIQCDHAAWESLILHPDYGTACVYWYQEDGRTKRVLRSE